MTSESTRAAEKASGSEKAAGRGTRSRVRTGAAASSALLGLLALALGIGILAGSELRHQVGMPADVAMWALIAGGAASLASGIGLLRLSRRRGGKAPLAVLASAALVLVAAVLAGALGLFGFGTPGGLLTIAALAATLALAAAAVVRERA